jgi:hypothetical protein
MCNCKQKPASPKIKYEPVGNINVISDPQSVTYTREEMDRALKFFITTKPHRDELEFVVDFHNKHMGEKFGYDVRGEAWIRIKKRFEHMNQQLSAWENKEK